jgi:molybdopterin-containing oxidoreductase family membrane subunit
MEFFFGWYSGSPYEGAMLLNRVTGPYAWAFVLLIACNVLTPQLLWVRRIRNNVLALWLISIAVNVGMWLERFVIVVGSLSRDYLPGAWATYTPTAYDWGLYIGTLGLFAALLFLFIRFLPVISIFEMRTLVPGQGGKEHGA